MAHRGSLSGVKVMSEKTWDIIHSDPVLLEEPDFENRTFYTTGGLGLCSMKGLENTNNIIERYCYQDREGWFGWFGLGGSAFMWHPELKISLAYAPTDLMMIDFGNWKAAQLQKKIVEVVRSISAKQNKDK